MPQIQTRDFGTLTLEKEDAIMFPLGVPAFENEKSFVLLRLHALEPFQFLQSTKSAGVCFPLLPATLLAPSYEIDLSLADQEALALDPPNSPDSRTPRTEEVNVFAVALLSPDRHTANLAAPIVINRSANRGVQAIRSDLLYSHEQTIHAPAEDLPC